jgi:hypothetical protein
MTIKNLERERAKLQKELAQPTERELKQQELERLEAEIAETREGEARAKAADRQVACRRAHGSKRDQYEKALQRLMEAARAVPAAAAEVDAIYRDLQMYEMEDAALSDRFGLGRSAFPTVTPPLMSREGQAMMVTLPPKLIEHGHQRPGTEKCEHQLRSRRTYKEIANTPAYDIITEAGLRPFPDLTPKQLAELASRQDREVAHRAEAQKISGELKVARALPVPGGGIRG